MKTNSSKLSKLSTNVNKHLTKGSTISAKQPENQFSLVDSEAKFAQLKEKLHRITVGTTINKENISKNAQPSQINQPKETLKVVEANITKSKQLKSPSVVLQETQRKKRKFDYKPSNQDHDYGENKDQKQLLKRKEQTLKQINRLLVIKQEYLSQLQCQLKQQAKQVCKRSDSFIEQPHKQTAQKVKAPNLTKIREQKQKLKEKSHIF